jgi:hypothetical protein
MTNKLQQVCFNRDFHKVDVESISRKQIQNSFKKAVLRFIMRRPKSTSLFDIAQPYSMKQTHNKVLIAMKSPL